MTTEEWNEFKANALRILEGADVQRITVASIGITYRKETGQPDELLGVGCTSKAEPPARYYRPKPNAPTRMNLLPQKTQGDRRWYWTCGRWMEASMGALWPGLLRINFDEVASELEAIKDYQ